MPLGNEATFDIGVDCIEFFTRANGDRMRIDNVNLTADNAATLAYLINRKVILEVEIKEKGT